MSLIKLVVVWLVRFGFLPSSAITALDKAHGQTERTSCSLHIPHSQLASHQ